MQDNMQEKRKEENKNLRIKIDIFKKAIDLTPRMLFSGANGISCLLCPRKGGESRYFMLVEVVDDNLYIMDTANAPIMEGVRKVMKKDGLCLPLGAIHGNAKVDRAVLKKALDEIISAKKNIFSTTCLT